MTPTADLMKQPFYNGTIEDFLRDHGICADDRKALVAALTASCDARDPWKCAYCGQINSPCALECSCCDQFKNHPTPAQPKASEGKAGGEVESVLAEVERATRKFPTWPTDPLHAVAVLGEEFGELTKALLQTAYEPHKVKPGEVRTEAIQTAAMALRFVMSLDAYNYTRCEQHSQATITAPGADDGL